MATGNITGKTNIPVKLYEYTGKNTSTAETIIDNNKKEISVNVNVEEVTKDCASKEDIAKSVIKSGAYILNDENNFINVEEIPSDYTGISFTIGDDGIMYLDSYDSGTVAYECESSPTGVNIYDYTSDIGVQFGLDGITKVAPVALVGLTHSFDELDPALKAIVDAAIADNGQNGVDCSQQQWNEIKKLLDKSLYFNYSGYSLLKAGTDGINDYYFGMSYQGSLLDFAMCFNLTYHPSDEKLFFIDGSY